MKLYIAEKPSLGRTLAQSLGNSIKVNGGLKGNDWCVTWCFGHMYEQFNPDDYTQDWKAWNYDHLPMIPKQWKIAPKVEAKGQIKLISEFLKAAVEVINVGDPDREGQLLIDELLEELQWKGTTKRLWLTDLTDIGIKKALESITDNSQYEGLLHSAVARQRADWLFGMNLTRAYTIKAQSSGYSGGVLSVGRVQTPTLALVVMRDQAIDNFKSIPFYEIRSMFNHVNGSYNAKLIVDDELLDDQKRLVNGQQAAKLIYALSVVDQGQVISIDSKEKTRNPPLPYSLSALQGDASKIYGYSALSTLNTAQELYEQFKISTYPRSDCQYLSENQHIEAFDILEQLKIIDDMSAMINGADHTIKSKAWNDNKTTAHTAIIPTGYITQQIYSSLNALQKNIYCLICRRYIAQFYTPQIVSDTLVITQVDKYQFQSKGRVEIQPGFTVLFSCEKNNDESTEENQSIPKMKVSDVVDVSDLKILDKKTTPPKPFTEGTLIAAMSNISKYIEETQAKSTLKEVEGIGTEATRASIIELLKTRDFLIQDKKNIVSTIKAREFINQLPESLTSAITTAHWEQKLKNIEKGKDSLGEFTGAIGEYITAMIKESSNIAIVNDKEATNKVTCPKCDDGVLNRIKGSKGYFWGCSRYQAGCKATYSDNKGAPILEDDNITGFECPKCNQQLKKIKTKAKKYFYPCSSSDCSFAAFPGKKATELIYKDENSKWKTLG